MSLPLPSPNTTVLVTGASAGIGAELARKLAARGHHLTIVARREDRLRELAAELEPKYGIEVAIEACDLSDTDERTALIQRLRRRKRSLAGLCNNAGYGSFGRFWELDLDREMQEVRINVEALHHLTGAFVGEMVARGEGAILNTGSLAGMQPQPSNTTYAATKAFVNSFSEALHAELAGTGVSCTALCPGPVKTEFTEVAGVDHLEGGVPSFLWATSEEVAESAVNGMVKGKRTVLPTAGDRVAGALGRYAPRTVLLPVVQRIASRTLS
jgi:uncharacterized protein